MCRFVSVKDESSAPVGKTSIETTLDELRITLSASNEYFTLFEVNGKLYCRIESKLSIDDFDNVASIVHSGCNFFQRIFRFLSFIIIFVII